MGFCCKSLPGEQETLWDLAANEFSNHVTAVSGLIRDEEERTSWMLSIFIRSLQSAENLTAEIFPPIFTTRCNAFSISSPSSSIHTIIFHHHDWTMLLLTFEEMLHLSAVEQN